ncbi:TPA: restriction endonuclease subunit S [Escherichia coli]|uniref:restriction endonuclease subunit S n=1 Tax=Escherichia coli TaxID=562 RepID=UPI000A186E87|nr:restriction endonuclease subunit S [Escherichia coli]EFF1834355.1 restriction endonuclease subunit S [Escherichia coli]EIN4962737.1 restriction endonuclease subunit S [Escherichia coli]EJB6367089.1 restriction endonuclease subunit S [Escherichia coli]EJG2841921.1 restriction endonuclease subunit S [Escherichia coli]MCV9343321.1 restriction endonuclease subunit S [Escherichia coli]
MSAEKLPEGWVECELSELGNIVTGKTPSTKEPSNFGGSIPFIKPGDLDLGGYIMNTADTLTEKGLSLVPTLPANSVVVTCIGNLGKVGITAKKSASNQQINALIPSEKLNVKFVYYQILTLKPWLESQSAATTIAIVNKSKFSQAPFKFPSLAEQKIIAEKLDTLLAQVDSTKARLEQIPQILKRFRQTVLGAAVSGKLTQNWRENNKTTPINKLLNKINEERNEARKNKKIKQNFGKYRPVLPLFQLPADCWEWVCFEQICETDNNALKAGPFGSALKKSDCVKSGHKVYGQEQVISGQESLETYRITEDKYQQLKSCATKPGDILISLVGTIGKTLILSNLAETGIINPRLVKIALHSEIQRQYVKLYLDGPLAYDFFKGFSHGGTMDILNLGILKELPIPLPSLEEQHEIVHHVEQLFAYADTIEKQVNNALARVNNLTQSILAKAFRGELTAQWRAENPDLISGENSAAALLEKIKAERTASGGKKASRKKP